MKRLLALLLAVMICTTALAACGSNDDRSQSNGGSSENTDGEVTVEEQTILDEQGVKAVVKGYGKFESEWLNFDHELLIDVTNGTDKKISFGLRHCSVNGYMTDSNYDLPIEAGATETFPAVFDTNKLESLGVTTIADYGFCIVVEDSESYETLVESDPISIKTSAYDGFEYKFDESGTVMYDADGIKIIAKGLEEDDYLGTCVKFYVANETDKNISVGVASGSVNGKEVENIYFGSDPFAGKRSVDILSIGEEERPEKMESLTLSFSIYDWDSGDPIIEKTEPVSIEF